MQQSSIPNLRSMYALEDATNPHHKSSAMGSRVWVNNPKMFGGQELSGSIMDTNALFVIEISDVRRLTEKGRCLNPGRDLPHRPQGFGLE